MEVKNVFILAFTTVINGSVNKHDKIVKAIFGYCDKGVYFFSGRNEETVYVFEKAREDVLKSFDLDSDKYVGKMFNITYRVYIEFISWNNQDCYGLDQLYHSDIYELSYTGIASQPVEILHVNIGWRRCGDLSNRSLK